jgi:hypothetical protein
MEFRAESKWNPSEIQTKIHETINCLTANTVSLSFRRIKKHPHDSVLSNGDGGGNQLDESHSDKKMKVFLRVHFS